MLDVLSIYILSSVRDWYLEVKVRSKERQYFLPVDLVVKSHKDLDVIDLSEPRHAQYLHKAWKRHQNAVHWVDVNLPTKKGLTFYQTRSNAIILQETLPAYCISKVARMESGEVQDEKVNMSPRSPPNISLTHERKRELGSEHAQRSEVGQLSGSSQSKPTNSNSNLWENGETRYQGWREHCARRKKNVPFLRRSMLILFTKTLFLRKERRDPLLKRVSSKHVYLKTERIPKLMKRHLRERGDSSV